MVAQTDDLVTVTTAKWNQSARLISNENIELQPKTVLKSANFPLSLINILVDKI